MARLDRIRWHCRRGLLELDLILNRFNERYLEQLSAEDLNAFESLLEEDDNDLLDLVMGRAELASERYRDILNKLQAQ